jgi:hypothetical protein
VIVVFGLLSSYYGRLEQPAITEEVFGCFCHGDNF